LGVARYSGRVARNHAGVARNSGLAARNHAGVARYSGRVARFRVGVARYSGRVARFRVGVARIFHHGTVWDPEAVIWAHELKEKQAKSARFFAPLPQLPQTYLNKNVSRQKSNDFGTSGKTVFRNPINNGFCH